MRTLVRYVPSDFSEVVGEGSIAAGTPHQIEDVVALADACSVFDEVTSQDAFPQWSLVSIAPSTSTAVDLRFAGQHFPRLIIRGGYDRSV